MSYLKIITLSECSSTNDILKEKKSLYPSFTVLRCKIQFDGKGRWGRKWFSETDKGLYFSILIKGINKNNVRFYPLSITFSLLTFFSEIGFKPKYQWPNDIYIKDKKIVGILSESIYKGNKNYLIVGVGVNVNHEKRDFPEELREKATSLRILKGEEISTDEIFENILKIIKENIEKKDSVQFLINRLAKYSRFNKDESILVKEKEKEYTAYFLEYISDGGILIEKRGRRIKLYEGEVLKIEI